ncbi:MAG: cold-shock protein [Candidatus Vogelbacteria bacterium CG10_big_fil_rev_8_21_14_0_10_45_14]|uniref:Cold-shock protein n=1 Tax=Candidatus Vogelbacteria bacterium CG10_big_fil_rev_8_21_14_0_10_45_14 TaxID=1975042 RepID=A0A2H0RL07_9BACT|nr:MAG: cold-shock protein [Candidatus Vogelbacteria bacterium CG10_big_fil_rev_8_21_14_0_10_45_14]
MQGTIKTLKPQGFGFITYDGADKDLFFHANELVGITFDELSVDDAVSFEIGQSPKGPNATNIQRA